MSLSNYIRRTKGEDREDINRLLGVMSDIFYPEPEEGSVQERIVLSEERRIRTLAVTDAILDVTATDTRNRFAGNATLNTGNHRKQIPSAVTSYPLIHTTTGSLIRDTEPDTNDSPLKTTDAKFGAGLSTDGSSYITITDDARLDDITTDLTIAFYYKPKANAGGTELLVSRDLGWQIFTTSGDTLNFRVYDGAWKTAVTYDYTADIDTWIAVAGTYKSAASGQKLYVKNVLQDSDSLTGAISTGTAPVKILGDGTSDPASGTAMAWLTVINEEWTTGKVASHFNGLTDMTALEDIFSIDFVGDENPTPAATSPFCVSS